MEQRKESLLARIKRVPVWVWITVAIGAIGLIIAFLSYRAQQQQAANNSTGAVTNGATLANAAIPAGGASIPAYSTDPNAYAGYGGWGAGYGTNAFDMQAELAQILALLQGQQNGATVPTGVSPVPPQSGPATFPAGATGASGISVSGILQPAGGGLSGGQTRPGLKLLGGATPPIAPPSGGGAIPPGPTGDLITSAMSAPISVSAARGSGLGPNPPTPGGSPAPGSVSSALRRLPPVPGLRKS